LVYGSVTDEASLAEAVRGKDYVFHSAGLTKARNVAEFLKVNAGGTRNVVSACANHNPALRRFVYISSQAAAGPSRDGTPLTEDAPCRPVSLYGKSKHEGELAVAEYAPSLPVTIVRPSAVFGPRDCDIFVFFQLANYRIMPIMGPPNGRASLIHVRDLAKAIVLAAESGKAMGQTYFAANPEPCSMIETGRLIAEALGKRCVRLRVPVFVLSFAAQIAHLVAALGGPLAALSPDKVTELRQPCWVCSTAKIAAHLGFAPQYSLAAGLRETARWYKENRWLR